MKISAFVLGLCLSACATTGPESWVEDEVDAASQRLLWQITAIALEKEDFPVGTGVDPSTEEVTTGWRLDLAPFKGEGFRTQAHVRYEKAAPGKYRVFVRVARESNEDLAHPMDPSYAKWKRAPDDTVQAQIIIQHIKAWMAGDLEVSEGASGPSPDRD